MRIWWPVQDGDFATIYLAPKGLPPHPHAAGRRAGEHGVRAWGSLLRQPLTAENVPNLFARNEAGGGHLPTPTAPWPWCWSVPLSSRASKPSGPATWRRPKKKVVRWDYTGNEAITLQRGRDGPVQAGQHSRLPVWPSWACWPGFEPHLASRVTTRMGQPFATLAAQV